MSYVHCYFRELDQNFVPSSNRISMRIVCFTVMMSGFILYSTYAATMTSFLSISLKTPSIATWEDAANAGKKSLPMQCLFLMWYARTLFQIPDQTLALLAGSATHDKFKRGYREHFHSIYQKTKLDKNAFYDQSANEDTKYNMLANGYFLIRHLDEIQSLMKNNPCKLVYPAPG